MGPIDLLEVATLVPLNVDPLNPPNLDLVNTAPLNHPKMNILVFNRTAPWRHSFSKHVL